ncbi:S8 family serine peptidase [Actinomyces sp. ICM47]|uniref:S8 family serine peptidase n=1 Tax=Actinomyces sp. ICM47 TaxID=936548 RepID=UPI0002733546|nr:S8 family serine peptidase [Actinomyces sp. ICM47]EJG16124.1 peptidase, S8/S53 family [Actinomyces sp. ICM47]
MHQRSWKTLIAGGAALTVGLTLTAFGAPSHAEGVAGITSEARAQDEVMNYAVNLPATASRYDFNAAVSKASENGVVLAQYPEFNSFFVQSVKAAYAPDLGKSLVAAGISYDSIGPTRYKTVTGDEVRTEQPTKTDAEANAVNEAAAEHETGLSADSQLNDFTPDEGDANAWGLSAIGAVEAQTVDVPRAAVTVAVMDTGIDPDHKDLKDRIDASRSVGCQVNGIPNQDPSAWKDDHYHGTHVAGTIAASHNGYGVDGVAPDATLIAIKTSNKAGSFYPEYVACAFDWAAEHNVDVSNSSYYMDPYAFWMPNEASQAAGLEAASRAVHYSKEHGVVNFAAEGNSDDDHDNPTIDKDSPNDVEGAAVERNVAGGIDVPAMLNDSVLSVSALKLPTGADPATAKLERAGFSNYGKNSVDVAAPGQRIWSTMPTWEKDPPFGYLSGTSMASPHAAGVAALVKEIHPDYTADEVIALVKKQAGYTYDRLAEPTDGKEYRGAGLVNALDAVLKDQPKPVMGSVEYSYDGGTDWRPLADAHVAGMIYVRTTVTGPVTTATMKVEDQDPVTVEGTGEFTGNQVVLLGGPYDTSKLPADEPFASVTVTAEGRNKDERADDDVADDVHFHVDASAHEGGAWVNDPAGWKYCYTDSTCAKGPLAIGADSYYFDENGILGAGWVNYDGAWHWLGTSGRIATGWAKVADAWYYMDNSGAMTTGWTQVRGSWFYLADSGKMATGWTKIGDSWYYFQESGAMATGWVNDGGTWYYLNEFGQMVTGRVQIDGTWYTFDKSGALRR